MENVYFYQGSVVAVRPGLGGNSWGSCRRKPNGSWTSVKSKNMPRVNTYAEAEKNLRLWAAEKGLQSAECSGCKDKGNAYCFRYHCPIEQISGSSGIRIDLRFPECEDNN